jgi:hypothetical protein
VTPIRLGQQVQTPLGSGSVVGFRGSTTRTRHVMLVVVRISTDDGEEYIHILPAEIGL